MFTFASAFLVDRQYSCLYSRTLYTFYGILCAMKMVFPDFSLTLTISKIFPDFLPISLTLKKCSFPDFSLTAATLVL